MWYDFVEAGAFPTIINLETGAKIWLEEEKIVENGNKIMYYIYYWHPSHGEYGDSDNYTELHASFDESDRDIDWSLLQDKTLGVSSDSLTDLLTGE